MPLYTVQCESHGRREIFQRMSDVTGAWQCDQCGAEAQRVYDPVYARIDDKANQRANDADPRTRGIDVGLRPRKVERGRDASGKMRYDLVPWKNAEIGSNQRAREIAKSQGLSPLDGGVYKTIPI